MARTFFNRHTIPWLVAAAFPCACALGLQAARPDEPVKELVGSIDGAAIAVQGPMTVRVEDGQTKTSLRSGADVRVKSGRATVDLVEGGQIAICGPAHFSVLKSGGSLTVALDTGTIHTRIEHAPTLTVYTALLQAKPIAIGGGAQETVVGLDSEGALTIRAVSGAVRVEHQLSGQSIVVPQNSDVLLLNGQLTDLRPGAGRSACELGELRTQEQQQVSVPATAEEVKPRNLPPANAKPNVPASHASTEEVEGPTYQVYLAPMRYDANRKVQPPADPNLIVMVRRVRVRPTLIFQGRVEGEALVAENHPAPPLAAPNPQQQNTAAAQTSKPPAPTNPTIVNRVRTFIKRLWNSNS